MTGATRPVKQQAVVLAGRSNNRKARVNQIRKNSLPLRQWQHYEPYSQRRKIKPGSSEHWSYGRRFPILDIGPTVTNAVVTGATDTLGLWNDLIEAEHFDQRHTAIAVNVPVQSFQVVNINHDLYISLVYYVDFPRRASRRCVWLLSRLSRSHAAERQMEGTEEAGVWSSLFSLVGPES